MFFLFWYLEPHDGAIWKLKLGKKNKKYKKWYIYW